MSELSFSSLKNSLNVKDYEEKKIQERKKNLLCLIAQHLREEGYTNTVTALLTETQLPNNFQVCDNIDLSLILQDFENYFFVRFQRYPKICRKIDSEDKAAFHDNKRNLNYQNNKRTGVSNKKKDTFDTKVKSKLSNISNKVNTEKKHCAEPNCLTVLPLQINRSINNEEFASKQEKILKPLGGFLKNNPEWYNLAEIITKDIVTQDLNVKWSDIVGLDVAKRLLKEAVVYPIKYPALFKGTLSPWKGLLLFGPPGTGKTLLAKAVATECRTTFFNITASSIVSKWRGDSEKLVRAMFDLARYHAPSTIFLDELDALASKRDGGSHSTEHEGSRRLKTELLIQLDGLSQTEDQVFFLCTSNFPWELDPAILRRLEKRILVGIPNLKAREEMLKHYLPETVLSQPLLKSNIDYSSIAEKTEGYSGSDIRLVCKETAMQSIRGIFSTLEKLGNSDRIPELQLKPIVTADVLSALSKTKPSASHLEGKYIEWQNQFGSI